MYPIFESKIFIEDLLHKKTSLGKVRLGGTVLKKSIFKINFVISPCKAVNSKLRFIFKLNIAGSSQFKCIPVADIKLKYTPERKKFS